MYRNSNLFLTGGFRIVPWKNALGIALKSSNRFMPLYQRRMQIRIVHHPLKNKLEPEAGWSV